MRVQYQYYSVTAQSTMYPQYKRTEPGIPGIDIDPKHVVVCHALFETAADSFKHSETNSIW